METPFSAGPPTAPLKRLTTPVASTVSSSSGMACFDWNLVLLGQTDRGRHAESQAVVRVLDQDAYLID